MNFGIVLCVVFSALWSILVFSGLETLTNMLLINAGVQLVLFTCVACIPFLRTGRVSYVDIAWPFGVALIGAQIILFADGDLVRKLVVGGIYLFIGLRMGIGALVMGKSTGVIFKTEFPRYVYRKALMEKNGEKHVRFHLLAEIMAQSLANFSVLALPGFLLATNQSGSIHMLEIAGVAIWGLAYLVETIADAQKLLFISKNKDGVCNVGLWRYSRHPNYFAEWLVWSGLVIASLPSWMALMDSVSVLVWTTMGVTVFGASAAMYTTLVYLTGAKPAEYYSVRKREGYKAYQEQTSMFFPWFTKA